MSNGWIAYIVSEMPWQPPPPPWTSHSALVATLYAIGYAPDSDYLLAISETGRGVFNALTGEKVGRDRDENEDNWWDTRHLIAQGIPPIDRQPIRTMGHHGGGLRTSTKDGWNLTIATFNWPLGRVILGERHADITTQLDATNCYVIHPRVGEDAILAYGFSDTGKSFVIANEHGTLIMFTRPEGDMER